MLLEPVDIPGSFDTRVAARGYCARCKREHTMVVGYAGRFADGLLRILTEAGRIDLEAPDHEADPRFSTAPLFGEARGQMFGVLVVRGMDGRPGLLKAFSGQYNGVWEVDGWVPPLVDVAKFEAVNTGVERFIKRLGRLIGQAPEGSPERAALVAKRRAVSRALMRDIHNLYRIPNLCGETLALRDAASGQGGIPTGMGDCCGPKLLGYAARHSLTPLGLAEFYVGRENRSGTRRHGGMYTACREKCERIMGHMLCEECGS